MFPENSIFNIMGIKIIKKIWKISSTLEDFLGFDLLIREGAFVLCKDCARALKPNQVHTAV